VKGRETGIARDKQLITYIRTLTGLMADLSGTMRAESIG
jgi:hypothetical protein